MGLQNIQRKKMAYKALNPSFIKTCHLFESALTISHHVIKFGRNGSIIRLGKTFSEKMDL